jgi:hypothetical protein
VSVFYKALENRCILFGFKALFHLISAWLLAKRVFTNKVELTPRICNVNYVEVCPAPGTPVVERLIISDRPPKPEDWEQWVYTQTEAST